MADNDEMMMPMAMADHDDDTVVNENEEDPLDVSIIVDDSALAQVTHTPDGKYIDSIRSVVIFFLVSTLLSKLFSYYCCLLHLFQFGFGVATSATCKPSLVRWQQRKPP
jgi:hypothetical protein